MHHEHAIALKPPGALDFFFPFRLRIAATYCRQPPANGSTGRVQNRNGPRSTCRSSGSSPMNCSQQQATDSRRSSGCMAGQGRRAGPRRHLFSGLLTCSARGGSLTSPAAVEGTADPAHSGEMLSMPIGPLVCTTSTLRHCAFPNSNTSIHRMCFWNGYCSFAYSAFAAVNSGCPGSASFQVARKSWYAVRALAVSPSSAYARAR